MEGAEDIFKKLSSLILSSPTYQDAIKNLSTQDVEPDFDVNAYTQLGHNWKDAFYKSITGDKGGGMLTPEKNPELASKLDAINAKISSMGFIPIFDPQGSWYFYGIKGYKPDGANKKIHIKIPNNNLELMLKLAELIQQNSINVRQFKFASKGSSFESRRDNFVIYLSKQGETNIAEFIKSINALGLPTDTGEDFKGTYDSLSQTEIVSLRLAAILLSRPGIPKPKYAASSLWKITEKEFVESDPVASRYLRQNQAGSETPPMQGGYQPKTLVLTSKGRPVTINIDTQLGKYSLQQSLGDEAQYFSDSQFQIKKSNDGWYLIPSTGAVNQTIINGRPVSGNTRLSINDTIGIAGGSGKQIIPLRVSQV